jgi:hypothetical protein
MSERYLLSQCCQAVVDVTVGHELATCPNCHRQFEVREEIDFAEFSSGSFQQYKWSADGTYIVRYHFHNMTLERLEGVAEQIKLLSVHERRPYILLPIYKALHDCLKKRLQQYLAESNTPNLTTEQKARIELDAPPGRNLLQLVDLLAEVYPADAQRITFIGKCNEIAMLLWVRNKEEHLAVAAWPAQSYVHVDRHKLPSEMDGAVGELGRQLLVDANNKAIDLLSLIYDLCAFEVKQWHYDRLDDYRLHHSE